MDQPVYDSLTDAEKDVLRRLASGRRPSEIASDLDRSVSTIRNQLHAARSKAGSSDSLGLARSLVALEADRQILPRHELPIAGPAADPAGEVHRPATADQAVLTFHEARAAFDFEDLGAALKPLEEQEHQVAAAKSSIAKLGIILGLTLLALMCIALAPEMGNTAQTVANLLYPPKSS